MINEPGDDLQLGINTVQRALYTHLENILLDVDIDGIEDSFPSSFIVALQFFLKIEAMSKILFNRVGIVSLHKENC